MVEIVVVDVAGTCINNLPASPAMRRHDRAHILRHLRVVEDEGVLQLLRGLLDVGTFKGVYLEGWGGH